MALIKVSDVSKQYKNGIVAVHDVNVEIDKGEFVFVIGSSGSGKSTFIKMLYREEKPTCGKIIIGGIDVAKLLNSRVYKFRRKIGVVFQDYKLLSKLTVYENVAYGLQVLGKDSKEVRVKTLAALKKVGLKEYNKHYPKELSGGEQQRVSIARALVNDPKLLICDEPTGNLDPETSLEIVNLLEEINASGTTIIMATHDKDIVNNLEKRVITFKEGKIIHDYKKGNYDNEVL